MPACPRCGEPITGNWVLIGKDFYHWNCGIEQGYEVIKNRGLSLLTYKNVVSVGVGFKIKGGVVKKEISLVFSVIKKEGEEDLKDLDIIPKEIEGISTDVIETGAYTAPPPPAGLVKPRKKRYRPVKGGSSISHIESDIPGTAGGTVKLNKKKFILTTNHVAALVNEAELNDPIIQPAKADGGKSEDVIGYLEDFTFIDFSRGVINELDAALISPINDKMFSESIINVGKVKGVEEADLGIQVQKSGRTTGLTSGHIIQIGVLAVVVYPGDRSAIFKDQILVIGTGARKFIAYGDSGSFVINPDTKRVVGLTFAGSLYRNYALITPMKKIIEFFGIEL